MEKIGAFVDADRVTAEGEWRPGDPAIGQKATPLASGWFNMLQRELVGVVESGGLTLDDADDGQLLKALNAMGLGTGQFQNYSAIRTYSTGEVVRGSDGAFYEFYDRDLSGTVQGVDPTNSANRPHVWMAWDGVRPGSTIEWRSETLPEGYLENDGAEVSRSDYRRVFAAHGTVYGVGDGSTTFLLPDDRGEFKRGFDNGRGVDPGRQLATHQLDQMQQITGEYSHPMLFNGNQSPEYEAGALQRGTSAALQNPDPSGGATGNMSIAFDSANSPGARTGDSTYPRNNAVIWLTKI